MSITLTPKLAKEYEDLFASCEINTEREKEVERTREKIVASKATYESVERATRARSHEHWFSQRASGSSLEIRSIIAICLSRYQLSIDADTIHGAGFPTLKPVRV